MMRIIDGNKIEEIPLITENSEKVAYIISYKIQDGKARDSVLIFPGGGYNHVSLQKEGSLIAEAFNAHGLNAYVLDYRVEPFSGHDYMKDAVTAVKMVRSIIAGQENKEVKLALMGFSAGGHLALMETEHYNDVGTGDTELDKENGKPDALILCYPVVTFCDPYAHRGSRANFLGMDHADDAVCREQYSAEKHVDSDFPPAFLWHCEADNSVPVENSLMLRDALDAAGVRNKLITYPGGSHGLGLAPGEKIISGWFSECVRWLKDVFS